MKSNLACNFYNTKEKTHRLSILLPEENHFWPRPLHTTMYSQSSVILLCFCSIRPTNEWWSANELISSHNTILNRQTK